MQPKLSSSLVTFPVCVSETYIYLPRLASPVGPKNSFLPNPLLLISLTFSFTENLYTLVGFNPLTNILFWSAENKTPRALPISKHHNFFPFF